MMTVRGFMLAAAVCALSLAACGAARAQEDSGAVAEVKSVLGAAMDIQTRPDLQGDSFTEERAKLVRKLIGDNFLAGEMAKESAGAYWDKASQKQKTEFQELFTKLFQDSYTRMVLNHLKRESVEHTGEAPEKEGVMVKTVIMRANEHIPVDYYVMKKGSRWLIADVVIDGVSIVENYRNSFGRVIQQETFEGLLKRMRTQSQTIS
jgi:phospholipid transport system substrate-binding protein